MKLTTITMTGADDYTSVETLLEISRLYPFVEWGILISASLQGRTRFPSASWIDKLANAIRRSDIQPKISLHLCGQLLRGLLVGEAMWLGSFHTMLDISQRIQLNFHAEDVAFAPVSFAAAIKHLPHTFIFQHDGKNDDLMEKARYVGGMRNCVPLFDRSHGGGVSPENWPRPSWRADQYGYAGGIGPHNIDHVVVEVAKVVPPDAEVWLDMETWVRSREIYERGPHLFDLGKVTFVLQQCAPIVELAHASK